MMLNLMLINCLHVACGNDVTEQYSSDAIVPEFELIDDITSDSTQVNEGWDAIPGQYRQEELRDTGRFKPRKSLNKQQDLVQSELETATVPAAQVRSEILRFMTPFGVAMHKYADVTPWAGSLSKAEFRVDIATYVPTKRRYYLEYDENATTCRCTDPAQHISHMYSSRFPHHGSMPVHAMAQCPMARTLGNRCMLLTQWISV